MTLLKWIFAKTAQVWFCFKRITTGSSILKWGFVYYETPYGSEREKLAFRKAIELWAAKNPEVLEIYPDFSPPDILRKTAFGNMYVYLHGSVVVTFLDAMDIFSDERTRESSKRESDACKNKYCLWRNLLLSEPNSKNEKIALQKLKEEGEI
jgi:hypothetical protein